MINFKAKDTKTSVRVSGNGVNYCVKKSNSVAAGCSFMMLELKDVNGKVMHLDIWSSDTGSFE